MTQSAGSLPPELNLVPDSELQRVLDIAALVGDVSNDDVNVSYTSLMIGLLWSGADTTSQWLQSKITDLGASVERIYQSRSGITDRSRADILGRISSGARATPRRDFVSISARTVLQEAASIAAEAGQSPDGPVGTRHLAAAYFFRNPPGHDSQFQDDWTFEPERWRRAFTAFIADKFADELQKWAQVLIGYLSEEGFDGTIGGQVLATYSFEPEAVRVLRHLEGVVRQQTPPVFTSVSLLRTLAALPALRDSRIFAEIVAKPLKVTEVIDLAPNVSPFEVSGSVQGTSRGFKSILDRARTLSRSVSGTETIGVRHLIASILVRPDSTANKQLVDCRVDIPLLRRKIYTDYSRNWLTDSGVQWNFSLVGRTPTSIASYSSDRADNGDDALDVTRYAAAFAAVISAEGVYPPLSIGIFGDWGSGKSFFMRLMREQTRRVSGLADVDAEGKRLFCSNVVSIEFNAWHYSEENLLASLIQTILLGLRKALVGADEESDFMDQVVAKLEIAQLARGEAEQNVKAAEMELAASDDRLKTARADAAKELDKLSGLKGTDILTIVRAEVYPNKAQNLAKAADLAETYLGVKGIRSLVAEQDATFGVAEDLVDQVGLTSRRVQTTGQWLLRAPVDWDDLRQPFWIAVMVVPVGGVGIFLMKDYVGTVWPALCAASAQLAIVVKFAHGFAQRHLARINNGLDAADKIRGDIDSQIAASRKQIEAQIVAAETARAEAQSRVDAAQVTLQLAEAKLRQAQADLEDCKSEKRIARLVQQRLEAKDYEKHLGIIAAIRNDFDTLTKLMKQMRETPRDKGSTIQPIDRIVLYIDDLDRCPTNKVVSVLEAIHLFLAFELFVVVVGVDVRWAARSLEEKYPYHLSPEKGASALDYLEKIFQIPFWLPPMQILASQNMIADLVPLARTAVAPGAQAPNTNVGLEGTENLPSQNVASSAQKPTGKNSESAKAEVLQLEPEERLFMLSLAGAVGKSPRRLKRFVNTYRILKGSIDALEREKFVLEGGRRGEYRSAMILLAIVTGAPRTAMELFEHLCNPSDSISFEKLTEAARKDPEDGPYVSAAFEVFTRSGLTDEEFKSWAPQIARFSFRAGRL